MRVNEQGNLITVQSDQVMEDIDQNIGGIDQTNLSMPIDAINENANSLISPLVIPNAQNSVADQAHQPMSEGTTNTNLTSDKSDQTGPETPNSHRKRARQRKQSSSNIQRPEFIKETPKIFAFPSTATKEAVVKQKDQINDQSNDEINDQLSDQRNDQPIDQINDQPIDQINAQATDQRKDQPSDQRNDQSSYQRNDELNQMLGLYDDDDQNIEPMFVDTNAPQMIDTSDFDQIAQLAGDDLMYPHPMEVYDEPNNAEEQFVMIPVGNSSQQIVAESVDKTKSNSKSGHGKSRQSADQSMRDYASPSIQQKQKAGQPKKLKIDEKTEKAKSKMGVEKAPIKTAKDKSKMIMERQSIKNKPIMIKERPSIKNKPIVIRERSPMKNNKSIVIPERRTMKNKSIMITEEQKTKADKGKSIMIDEDEEESAATDSSDEMETDGSTDKLADANTYDVVKRIRNNFKYEVSKILAMFVYRQKKQLRRLYFIEWKGYKTHSRWVLSEDMNSLELLANFIEECSMSSALDALSGDTVMRHVAKLLQKNDEAKSVMQSMGKQPEQIKAEADYMVFAKNATEGQKNEAIDSIDEFVELIKENAKDG
ncbi:hypothetical protein niasHT_023072 [Heterodera trifolii]|uniref:Chromo domain-containing protein n=1 Tax=Heterodera trifolii TaxID=157864 RepID=A0ABD2KF42_9BILA